MFMKNLLNLLKVTIYAAVSLIPGKCLTHNQTGVNGFRFLYMYLFYYLFHLITHCCYVEGLSTIKKNYYITYVTDIVKYAK